ncbi:MAG: potassium channel family protein [Planctomycetota bacterium]
MTSALNRARRGIGFLSIVVLCGVVGYRLLGYSWLEALWMVVITIFSVGYGEKSTAPAAVQLLTIAVIIFGISSAFYTFGGLLEMVLEGELKQVLGHNRRARDIDKLTGHVIICGFGRIGQILAAELARQNLEFVVIDQDAQRTADAEQRDYLFMVGDATSDEVLIGAGVGRACVLVTALPQDASNVFITLTGRNLNPHCLIVARAEHRSSVRKLQHAGANRVVMPATSGAQQMARLITRPSTADMFELMSESNLHGVAYDEMEITTDSPLAGRTVRDSAAHASFQILILCVKSADGSMQLAPNADFRMQPGQTLVMMGRQNDIDRFRAKYHAPDQS